MSKIKVDTIQSTQHATSTIGLTSTGATINGDCNATTFTGSGANLTSLPSANLTGALPAIDGSALTSLTSANLTGAIPANLLTNAGGGAYEFVKKIQPSVATTTITEHGLDYDSVYKLVIKYVLGTFNNYLKFYPHLDNSTTSFTPDGSGYDTCKQRQIDINGVSSQIESTDHWSFGQTQVGYEFGGSIDFWTGYRPWIIGNVRYLYNDGFVQLYGRKGRVANTNNDPNQTDTYAKVNGFRLRSSNNYNIESDLEILVYKYAES